MLKLLCLIGVAWIAASFLFTIALAMTARKRLRAQ
jgi:hypothetical protein